LFLSGKKRKPPLLSRPYPTVALIDSLCLSYSLWIILLLLLAPILLAKHTAVFFFFFSLLTECSLRRLQRPLLSRHIADSSSTDNPGSGLLWIPATNRNSHCHLFLTHSLAALELPPLLLCSRPRPDDFCATVDRARDSPGSLVPSWNTALAQSDPVAAHPSPRPAAGTGHRLATTNTVPAACPPTSPVYGPRPTVHGPLSYFALTYWLSAPIHELRSQALLLPFFSPPPSIRKLKAICLYSAGGLARLDNGGLAC
jgi:hypothetical protein